MTGQSALELFCWYKYAVADEEYFSSVGSINKREKRARQARYINNKLTAKLKAQEKELSVLKRELLVKSGGAVDEWNRTVLDAENDLLFDLHPTLRYVSSAMADLEDILVRYEDDIDN